jgi:hypothetical protein
VHLPMMKNPPAMVKRYALCVTTALMSGAGNCMCGGRFFRPGRRGLFECNLVHQSHRKSRAGDRLDQDIR